MLNRKKGKKASNYQQYTTQKTKDSSKRTHFTGVNSGARKVQQFLIYWGHPSSFLLYDTKIM
jgi:Zn/Cd-binding protein ZinT